MRGSWATAWGAVTGTVRETSGIFNCLDSDHPEYRFFTFPWTLQALEKSLNFTETKKLWNRAAACSCVSRGRWTVIFHPNEKETDEMKMALANDTNTAQPNEDTTSIFVMNNYFGIGIDADLCLDFHKAREENPDKFNSRSAICIIRYTLHFIFEMPNALISSLKVTLTACLLHLWHHCSLLKFTRWCHHMLLTVQPDYY